MKKALLILLLCSSWAAAQDKSRFSIAPYFGLGMRIPADQTSIQGNEWMSYLWKFFNIGSTLDNEQNQQFGFNTTNRLGFTTDFRINNWLSINASAERVNLMTAYKPSLVYSFGNQLVEGFYDNLNFMGYGAGIKVNTYNFFYKGRFNYYPNLLRKRSSGSENSGYYRNNANTGLVFSYNTLTGNKYNIYLALGQEVDFLSAPATMELGVNIAPQALYRERVDFYQNGSLIGSNSLDHNTSTIFLSIQQPIYFNKRDKAPKPPKEKPEKKPKPEKVEEPEIVAVGSESVKVGEQLILKNIQFERGRSELDFEGMGELQRVLETMTNNPKAKIEISGHTSTEGTRKENIKLSKSRAEACKNYLIRQGINGKRIKTVGYGPDRPISNIDQEINRRVEMKIISLD